MPTYNAVLSQTSTYKYEANSARERLTLDADLSVGWGRIYMGTYAATALYMINELRSHALLAAEPDYRVLDSLSEIIYQYRLKHAVDSRLLRIEALSAVVNYLKSRGIIDNAGPVASLYLQDIWDYFPRDYRPFGFRSRLILGISRIWQWDAGGQTEWWDNMSVLTYPDSAGVVDTSFSSVTQTSAYNSSDDTRLRYFGAAVEYEHPLDLRTQLSASLMGRSYFNSGQNEGGFSTDYSRFYDLGCSLGVGYIVSSRTRLDFSSQLTYTSRGEVNWSDDDPVNVSPVSDYHDLTYKLSARATYRLAIPTALTLSAEYSGDNSKLPSWYDYSAGKTASHGYSLGFSINHYLY
jgi:hypothetical protein